MNNFDYCLSIGKSAEEYVADYLTSRGNKVEDVSYDPMYMSKDTDFLLYKNGAYTTLEVKHDSKMEITGNFFFEVGFDRMTGYKPGWFSKCAAEYICFVGNTHCYIIKFDKDVIAANAISRRWCNYTDNCFGDAYLLSIDKARELDLIAFEWDIATETNYDF